MLTFFFLYDANEVLDYKEQNVKDFVPDVRHIFCTRKCPSILVLTSTSIFYPHLLA